MSTQQPNPWNAMKPTGSNTFSCTNNGKTVVVKGANDASSAARQAFGASGDKATVVQTTSK
jgi:hypothetical protein